MRDFYIYFSLKFCKCLCVSILELFPTSVIKVNQSAYIASLIVVAWAKAPLKGTLMQIWKVPYMFVFV